MPDDPPGRDVAVLASGGIESAVLCVELLRRFPRVFPVYVRCGLGWEAMELDHFRGFLRAVDRPGLMPLHVLEEPVGDLYGTHWSTGGADVPGAETPDEAVYLPGRNLLLGAKAAVWCRLRGVGALAFGSLGSNPFPDSTPDFFRDLESVMNRALGGCLKIIRPFGRLHKPEVIRRGRELNLPLHLTFSCIDPAGHRHCGRCNKCAERRGAFRAAGVADRTPYAVAEALRAAGPPDWADLTESETYVPSDPRD